MSRPLGSKNSPVKDTDVIETPVTPPAADALPPFDGRWRGIFETGTGVHFMTQFNFPNLSGRLPAAKLNEKALVINLEEALQAYFGPSNVRKA